MRLSAALVAALVFLTGCGGAAKMVTSAVQDGSRSRGILYYVGGAGQLGNVGFISIPLGMQDGGYEGYVELVPWQGFVTAVDQINYDRNRGKAIELGDKIRRAEIRYPDSPIDIIALSAGTGIATFALESLPENVRVRNVVFLGCSMSSRYDLTRALKRVDGKLYVFYSEDDAILSRIVPYTGTVDRKDTSDGIAGLDGFMLPSRPDSGTLRQYRKVRDIRYMPQFAETGYDGGHMSSTERKFIARYVAPLILGQPCEVALAAHCPADDAKPPRPRRAADRRKASAEPLD